MTREFQIQMVDVLPRLRRFAIGLCGDASVAEDLIQDTCVRALANAEQWEEGTRLDSWMYRIAQNAWVDRLRAQRLRGVSIDVYEAFDLHSNDDARLGDFRLLLSHVLDQIAELSQDQQDMLAMVCKEGLTYREVAERLQLPIGTVMSRLARLRSTLRASLGDEHIAV